MILSASCKPQGFINVFGMIYQESLRIWGKETNGKDKEVMSVLSFVYLRRHGNIVMTE